MDFADKQVTEISCHGLGARLLAPDTRTVIDIGGQDSKVIQLDAEGNLSDFLMNDKCAAGTGRFLDVISRTLGASVEQLDSIHCRRRAACDYQHVHGVCRIGGH
ncbi:(R)-2-hydroxyglutaryl-CoA dehydratase activator [Klebsiella variicola]|uniref:(R)-2-hydroxyglutaryl-CoA dehydratase activator n=1 Tax=Klebsiella variicola TaxID=244366 RepID=A0A7H4MCQ0_KLEVA|nr:(R)-2-hydroxyglutaryl-CoA dehydratase activator [Klebsiella variicola]